MTRSDRRYRLVAALLAVVAFGLRAAYVYAQPDADPWFSNPAMDGQIYADWARSLLEGGGGPDGAYYQAPGYPWFLAGLFSLAGLNFGLLYLIQHGLTIASAWFLGEVSRKSAGAVAGWATMILVLGYQPLLFFASRPVGESVAIFLLAWSVLAYTGSRPGRVWWAGLLVGLAVLVRPNFLLVPLAWMILEAARKRFRASIVLAGCLAVVLVPVAIRNHGASGHWVPVSSNAGLTLYHGNGEGALGIFTPVDRFSGRVGTQRDEATRIARELSGTPTLDEVEADRWWGRRAMDDRLRSPGDTVFLLFRKVSLTLAGAEIGLDYHPGIDSNRWRHVAPVPFALILALAAAGGISRKYAGGARWETVAALAALALTPIVFYVSCRYRLPLVALLAIPAGIGAAWILEESGRGWKRSAACLVLTVAVLVVSWWMPTAGLEEATEAGALANRAGAWHKAGNGEQAAIDIARALELDPGSSPVWFQYGTILEGNQDLAGAEQAYSTALEHSPGNPDVAGNLAGILIRTGRPAPAAKLLGPVVAASPWHRVCQVNRIVALAGAGNRSAAREAARQAQAREIEIPSALWAAIEQGERE